MNSINNKKKEIDYQLTYPSPYPFFIVRAGITTLIDTATPNVYRNFYAMEYVYEGKGVIHQQNHALNVSAGDFIVTRPGYFYSDSAKGAKPWKKLWCVISNSPFMSGLLSAYNIDNLKLFSQINTPLQLENIFDLIKNHNKEPQTPRKVEQMIFKMICDLSDFSSEYKQAPTIAETGKAYIDNVYGFNISIENICKQLSISPSHFFRLFKKEYGISPNDYIIRKKIDHAVHLLNHTSLNINQISESLGYVNTSSFSNVFCRKMGMSPNEYRKKNRIISNKRTK